MRCRDPMLLLPLLLLVLHTGHGQQKQEAVKLMQKPISHAFYYMDKLYVASTDKMFILNKNLKENASAGLCEQEDQQCTNNVTVFLMNQKKNELYFCGTRNKGACQRRSVLDIKERIGKPVENIVAVRAELPARALITPDGNLLIAATKGRYAISTRHESFDTHKRLAIHVDSSVTDKTFIIDYKAALEIDQYKYFLANQKRHVGSRDHVTKLTRLCNYDIDTTTFNYIEYNSYVDIELTCEKEGKVFNVLQDAIFVSGTYLMGVFVSQDDLEKSHRESAVCVTTLQDIESSIQTARDQFGSCTDAGLTASQRYFPKSWAGSSCQNRSHEFDCPAADFFETFKYVIGVTPLPMNLISVLPEHVTKIFGRTLDSERMDIHLGTGEGQIFKYNFYGIDTPLELYDMGITVQKGMPIVDIYEESKGSSDNRKLFVVTRRKIVKYSETDCSEFETCEATMKGKNPLCGWCILDGKSTWKSKCLGDWVSSLDQCVSLQLTPSSVYVKNPGDKVTLTLNGFNPANNNDYKCSYEDNNGKPIWKENVISTGSGGGWKCQIPTSVTVHSTVRLNLFYGEDIFIAGTDFLFFDCVQYSSCGACTSVADPDTTCAWCTGSNSCQVQTDGAQCLTQETTCPKITDVETKYVPSGVSTVVTFTASNLNANTGGTYSCTMESAPATPATATDDSISCTLTETVEILKQQSDLSIWYEINGNKVKVDISNGKETLPVIVYRCDQLGSDCSHCQSVKPHYKCQWCGGKCVHRTENCNEACPAPSDIKVSPADGPYRGPTDVTITGSNLGTTVTGTKITLVGETCGNVKVGEAAGDDYIDNVPNSIICTVEGVQVANEDSIGKAGDVTVNVIGSGVGTGDRVFTFKVANITSIFPTDGPKIGGTPVTLKGTNLGIGNMNLKPWYNSRPFEECTINTLPRGDIHFLCKTPAIKNVWNGNVAVVLRNGLAAVVSTTSLQFTRKENPVIQSVTPQSGIISGGNKLTFTGTRINNAHNIKLTAEYGDSMSAGCLDASAETVVCQVPTAPLQVKLDLEEMASNSGERAIDSEYVEVDTVLALDGVTYTFRLRYHPDPHFTPLGGNEVTVITSETQWLTLNGTYLNLVVKEKEEIKITIGQDDCVVVKLSEDSLKCYIPEDRSPPGNLDVNVTVGNYHQQVGRVKFQEENVGDDAVKKITIILAAVGGTVLVLVIIGVVLGVVMYRRKAGKKATPSRLHELTAVSQ